MKLTPRERLATLLEYVPTGTTEGEEEILQRAFVQIEEFQSIITPPPGSPRLLVGKKGSGKSAIIDFASRLLTETKIPHVKLKPDDIELPQIDDSMSVGQLTSINYQALVRAIAGAVGSQMSGLVTGTDKTLYEEAQLSGLASQDFISKSADLLAKLAKPYTQADLSKLLPNTKPSASAKLEAAISKNAEITGEVFYIFIDDTDQVASPGISGHLNRIWALILATRKVTQRIPKLRCLVSLRDEIWRSLTIDPGSQRDQTDHFALLVKQLNPTLDHVQQIVERRLFLAAEECQGKSVSNPYPLFFEGKHPKMPTSDKTTTWKDIIRTNSRRRPRDAVQLVNMLVADALSDEDRITEKTLEKVMPKYSEQRVTFMAQEFELECPSIPQIVRSFGSVYFDYASFSAKSEFILEHLRSLPSSFSIRLRGEAIQPDDDDQVFRLWTFLFSIGFFYPRVSDDRQPKGYRHVQPEDEPLFVHRTGWNVMQNCVWEIHPAFREYIIRVAQDEKAKYGLPPKPKGPGRRRN